MITRTCFYPSPHAHKSNGSIASHGSGHRRVHNTPLIHTLIYAYIHVCPHTYHIHIYTRRCECLAEIAARALWAAREKASDQLTDSRNGSREPTVMGRASRRKWVARNLDTELWTQSKTPAPSRTQVPRTEHEWRAAPPRAHTHMCAR